MHVLIYALIDVDENSEYPEHYALGHANMVFDELVGATMDSRSAVFDYYTTFDDDTSNVSGPARFGEKPTAISVDDPVGARMLHRGWKYTKAEFESNIERVREGLKKYSNEQIREDVDADMVRYYMNSVGEYRGPSIRLYTEYGEGIRARRDLNRVLDESENLWIVPADVHY